jgi:cardiolipin synthase
LSAADYLSLVRIPLGLAFLGVAGRPLLALVVLVAAGISDVLDGWVARRQRSPDDHGPHRGDWLDPLCDKLFVGSVVVGIYLVRRPPVALLLLLVLREVLQAVAMLVLRIVPALHRVARGYNFRAHILGKATTVAQFLGGAALLLGLPVAPPLAWLAGGLGAISVFIYISRIRELFPHPPLTARPSARGDR